MRSFYKLFFPNSYQNQLTYTTNDLYLSAKYRFKFKNFTLLTQADAHQLFNQLEIFYNQIEKYISPHNKVTILSAFPIFIHDYYGNENTLSKII